LDFVIAEDDKQEEWENANNYGKHHSREDLDRLYVSRRGRG
jgi:hypothetical protein